MAAHQDFVSGENQPERLRLSVTLEFSKDKFIVGQQQEMLCRDFNAKTARVRVIRPTLGCFYAHGFVWFVDDAGV